MIILFTYVYIILVQTTEIQYMYVVYELVKIYNTTNNNEDKRKIMYMEIQTHVYKTNVYIQKHIYILKMYIHTYLLYTSEFMGFYLYVETKENTENGKNKFSRLTRTEN